MHGEGLPPFAPSNVCQALVGAQGGMRVWLCGMNGAMGGIQVAEGIWAWMDGSEGRSVGLPDVDIQPSRLHNPTVDALALST
eukprot:4343051-Prymnesium_polylepis.2